VQTSDYEYDVMAWRWMMGRAERLREWGTGSESGVWVGRVGLAGEGNKPEWRAIWACS